TRGVGVLLAQLDLDLLVGARRQAGIERRLEDRLLEVGFAVGHLALEMRVELSKDRHDRMFAPMLRIRPRPATGDVQGLGHGGASRERVGDASQMRAGTLRICDASPNKLTTLSPPRPTCRSSPRPAPRRESGRS